MKGGQEFDVWVWDQSKLNPPLVQYTTQPFPTREAALRWAKRYIPSAGIEVRARSGETGGTPE